MHFRVLSNQIQITSLLLGVGRINAARVCSEFVTMFLSFICGRFKQTDSLQNADTVGVTLTSDYSPAGRRARRRAAVYLRPKSGDYGSAACTGDAGKGRVSNYETE